MKLWGEKEEQRKETGENASFWVINSRYTFSDEGRGEMIKMHKV